jgi:hypothetical protein
LRSSRKRARRLLFVRVDEERIRVRLLGLQHGAGEIELARIGRDVGDDLDAGASSAFIIVSRPPLPKSLLTQMIATSSP